MANKLSKKDIEILKKFDIENPETCSIVKDFNLMLDYVIEKTISLTANNIISSVVLKEINDFLSYKIEFNKPKISYKSYPNVSAMFLLLRLSGLTKIETIKSKNVLVIENEIYEKWKKLNKTEQFFHILKTIVFNFTLEPLNINNSNYFIYMLLNEFSTNTNISLKNKNLYNFFDTKVFLSVLEQFGFITTFSQLNPVGDWEYTNINVSNYGNVFCNYIKNNDLMLNDEVVINKEELDEEREMKKKFDKEMKKIFTNYINIIEIENKIITDSNFIFEVKTKSHNFKLKISISSEAILDQLCMFILDSLDFDYDHMYSVEFKNNLGQRLFFGGAPEMSFIEPPTAEDITIGELPITVGKSMLYIYDFGDYWKFNIKLLEIEKADVKLEAPKLLELKGEIPQQYKYDDDEDDDFE